MTPLRDAAENATAGVPVGEVVGWMHPTAGWCHHSVREVLAHCQNGGPIPIPLVRLSELDTARAEIERLRGRLRDAADERDNLSTIVATEIDDVAGAELDDLEERAITAESALTAAQARIAEQQASLEAIELACLSEDDDSAAINANVFDIVTRARATLSPAVKEPK